MMGIKIDGSLAAVVVVWIVGAVFLHRTAAAGGGVTVDNPFEMND